MSLKHKTQSASLAAIWLAALAAFLSGAPSFAQAPAGAAPGQFTNEIITTIQVRGNERIEPETIGSYLAVAPGQPFDPALIDLSLKTLFRTGLFADVRMSQEGSALIIQVRENPIINRVVFEGNKKLKEDKLVDEVQLAPRIVFTRAKVQADVQRIVELYRRSGRFAATVDPQVVQLPQNRVDLVFEIDEGPTTGVSKINFVGNKAFNDRKLRSVVVTAESHWWNLFTSNDNYDPDRLEYDQEQLRQHYNRNGYADFRVTSAVAELTPDRKDFFITFTVEEGEEYNFGEISVETSLEKLDAERLENFVGIQEGALFNAEQIENAEDSLTFAAGVAGYAFVDIRPRISRNRVDRTVDITFQVNEGPRVYIERINIGGNTRTLDQIIRREMRIAEGDAFNRILLDRSEQRVRSLGFFGQVEVTEEPGTTPDRSIVNLSVEERSTGTFSVGVGFSSIDNFIADVSIQERNLLGRGQFLRFRVSASSRRQQIDLRFTEPYFLDRNLAAGFELFSIRTNFRESSFDNFTNGVGINAGFPISEYGRMGLRYTFRLDDIDIDNDILCENELNARTSLCRSAGQRTTSSIGYSVSYDFRNDPIRPSRGWRWVWSQDLAGVGGDVNYVRTETSISYFKPIWKGLIANVRGNAGYIEGWAGRDVRLNDRFFRGATSFRGFRVAGVGPRDLDLDDPIGGKLYAIGTAEVFFPLGLPEEFGVRAGLFSDFGTVGLLDPRDRLDPFTSQDGIEFEGTRDDLSLRVTAGVSVSWDSPFGPIRLDFAEVFAREDYDRTEGFRFSAGTSF